MDDEPILNNREKRTLVKVALGLVTVMLAAPYVTAALAIGFLFFVAMVGMVIGLADWFLWYGLPTLGVFVVFVLVLRWLFAPKPRDLSRLGDDFVAREPEPAIAHEAELEVLRMKVALAERSHAAARKVDARKVEVVDVPPARRKLPGGTP